MVGSHPQHPPPGYHGRMAMENADSIEERVEFDRNTMSSSALWIDFLRGRRRRPMLSPPLSLSTSHRPPTHPLTFPHSPSLKQAAPFLFFERSPVNYDAMPDLDNAISPLLSSSDSLTRSLFNGKAIPGMLRMSVGYGCPSGPTNCFHCLQPST